MNTLVTVCALAAFSHGPRTTGPQDPIEAPPASLVSNGFYSKCVYYRDLPIIGSSKVEDRAFRMIVATFTKMLARVPDKVFAHLVEAGSHYCILAEEEGQTDLPEYADLRNDPNMDWNKRARGLGGLITSAAEENILEYPTDRYKGESIYIHEFGHTLADFVFAKDDPKFMNKLQGAYDAAIARGLWKNTYSATNRHEYWAEGVQMYFDCARMITPANGVHNEIGNREQLKAYDRGLYDLVDKAFRHNSWRYEGTYNKTGKVATNVLQ